MERICEMCGESNEYCYECSTCHKCLRESNESLESQLQESQEQVRKLRKGVDEIWYSHTYHQGKKVNNLCKALLSETEAE